MLFAIYTFLGAFNFLPTQERRNKEKKKVKNNDFSLKKKKLELVFLFGVVRLFWAIVATATLYSMRFFLSLLFALCFGFEMQIFYVFAVTDILYLCYCSLFLFLFLPLSLSVIGQLVFCWWRSGILCSMTSVFFLLELASEWCWYYLYFFFIHVCVCVKGKRNRGRLDYDPQSRMGKIVCQPSSWKWNKIVNIFFLPVKINCFHYKRHING